jgi:hypothetical protein
VASPFWLQSMATYGKTYVLVGFNVNTGEDLVMASKDGTAWESVTTGGLDTCCAVAYGDGKDDSERRVDMVKGDRTVTLWIGRSDAVLDGVPVQIDASNAEVKPFLSESGRTMLPPRFIVESLGATVLL